MITPLEVLKKYWNYDTFRAPQDEIVKALLEGKHVFALLPTGAGKSICFQVPALATDGVCIVISPLIALMQDQINHLKKKHIKAVMLSATLNHDEVINAFDNLRYGNYKFLYLSPERLQSEFIQEKIKELHVNFIAIDEAHCISEWGHDFRPSYRKVAVLIKLQPNAKVIALTASATKKVSQDIVNNLGLEDITLFKQTLQRPELSYSVIKTNFINQTIKEILHPKNSPAIVYTSSRKAAKSISDFLNRYNLTSGFYHGGLTVSEKKEAYHNWLTEKKPIMVATNAFGMGIDKNNVSTIIHANLPFSIENYLQESGRAGRNGKHANAYLLYNDATIDEYTRFFNSTHVSLDFLKLIYHKLNQFFHIALGEKPNQSFKFDTTTFCNAYTLPRLKVLNAITILDKEGIIAVSKNFSKKSSLRFTATQQQLFNYTTNSATDALIKVLLRTYGGVFTQQITIDEGLISQKIDLKKNEIYKYLHQLHNDKIIDYKPVSGDYLITFLVPREDRYTINNIAKDIKQRSKVKINKSEAIIQYIHNTNVCRSQQLLEYFGEINIERCGICDVCLSTQKEKSDIDVGSLALLIIEKLKVKPLTSIELIEIIAYDKNSVLSTLQLLLEKNKIAINSHNKFQLK